MLEKGPVYQHIMQCSPPAQLYKDCQLLQPLAQLRWRSSKWQLTALWTSGRSCDATLKSCDLWPHPLGHFVWYPFQDSWASVLDIIIHYATYQDQFQPFAGPGHWNDPDMVSSSKVMWFLDSVFKGGILCKTKNYHLKYWYTELSV